PHPRGLESQARQTAPEGPRRALDGQVYEGQARRGGAKRVNIAIPAFGYKNHIGIDRAHGLIRTWRATHAARHDGAELPGLIDKQKPASDEGADPAYGPAKNEEHRARNGLRSKTHRKKPKGKPMPEAIASANGKKSKVRAGVEHVFARQKGPMALVIRTI